MDLYECLQTYKAITLELIDKTKQEESLEQLLDERAQIINQIGNIEFFKEELMNMTNSLEIFKLDNELQTLIKSEKIKIKNKIDNIRKTREARMNYSNMKENPTFFSARG